MTSFIVLRDANPLLDGMWYDRHVMTVPEFGDRLPGAISFRSTGWYERRDDGRWAEVFIREVPVTTNKWLAALEHSVLHGTESDVEPRGLLGD